MKRLCINIRKPIHGNFVYINGDVLDRAIKAGAKLEIIIPNGSAIVDPAEWKKNGKLMKKVFKYPDNPMLLYGDNVPIT